MANHDGLRIESHDWPADTMTRPARPAERVYYVRDNAGMRALDESEHGIEFPTEVAARQWVADFITPYTGETLPTGRGDK